ncbi:MAG: PqqD family protein [Actinomycetota bacterium]|nr:PqqD family protein [Actinomycetota bacterium]
MTAKAAMTVPVRRTELEARREGEQVWLRAPDKSHAHVLNATAFALWELCDGITTPEEMVEAICTLFGVARGDAERDVELGLADLARAGLVEWRRPCAESSA